MSADPDWPSSRWGLSAPESYVVLNGPAASGTEAFKLGLMELVARGVLALETSAQRVLFGTKQIATLRDGPRAGSPREQPLAAIWRLYERAPRKHSSDGQPQVAVESLARAAVKHYQSLSRYVSREVLPPLVERGLYEVRHDRVLLIFPRTRYILSPSGEAARADLQRWLDVGAERFAGWADADPAHALAYAGMAGAALLLMPPLFPDLQRLRSYSPSETYVETGGLDAGGLPGTGLDLPSIDLPSIDLSGLDFGSIDFSAFDFSAFDALDSAMGAIDAGVDSGGGGDGGGGGDSGGGGDGGGGGGGES